MANQRKVLIGGLPCDESNCKCPSCTMNSSPEPRLNTFSNEKQIVKEPDFCGPALFMGEGNGDAA